MALNKNNRIQKVIALGILVAVPLILLRGYNRLHTSHKNLSFKEVEFLTPEEAETSKHFVIVIAPTAKNEQVWERNLDSIFNQQYDNYRVVYLDEGSSNRLYERISNYISVRDGRGRVQLQKADPNTSLFERYCQVVRECRDDEVIVHCDGNDWFAHDKVLEKLNEAYSKEGVWLTYGQYLEYPSYKKSSETMIRRRLYTDNRFRRIPWMTAPLKTYYAKLFKQINLNEIYQDDGGIVTSDWQFMLPMVKMARCHIQYIPEVLYVHNINHD